MGSRDYEGVFLKNKSGEAIDPSNPLSTSDVVYKLIKFDPSDKKPDYIGLNVSADALDIDTDWEISKFTYSGNDVIQIERRTGAWQDRAILF